MQLPTFGLNYSMLVLEQRQSRLNEIGEAVPVWEVIGVEEKCGKFPAGRRTAKKAELEGVRAEWEVYTERSDLDPQKHRLRIAEVDYEITVVSRWDNFTVIGVVQIEP